MRRVSELQDILGQYFDWHKSRLDCFTQILLSLFMVCTVNLRSIALAMTDDSKIDSRYRRVKSFFTQFKMNRNQIARWLFSLYADPNKKIYLTMDRTNWYFGKKKINAFVLAIAHEGVAIPIHWMMLNKAGNSTAEEQIKLVRHFVQLFGVDAIAGLLADREFANHTFFKWLMKNKIPFFVRAKENSLVRLFKKSKPSNLKRLFNTVNNKTQNYYPYSIFIFDLRLNVAAGRSETGELLIVVTNSDCKNAVPIYLRRWEIECLFQCLKGRGFNFEDTHLTNLEKIEKLIAVLAVGTAWAIKVGEWRAEHTPIRFNKHRGHYRPQYSYFRYGLEFIRDALLAETGKIKQFKLCIQQIINPPILC